MRSNTTKLMDIKNYNKKFESYPEDLLNFCNENKIKLPGIDTFRGQAIALMAQPEIRGKQYITRNESDTFFEQIGMKTNDSIQAFNKATGLKKVEKRNRYCLVYPYECDSIDIDKRKGCSITGDKNEEVNRIKNWFKKYIVDVPNDDWQIGHLDPTIADASEKNLAYQPPIQAKYRNRFKWDSMFHRMWPTAQELTSKWDEYYTSDEQKKLLESLMKNLNL